jgi:hypothetical protein
MLAGEYPAHVDRTGAARRLAALLSAGIDFFIDLTEPHELRPYLPLLQEQAALHGTRVSYQRLPIVDFDVPDIASMRAILLSIDGALADDHHVYVHCWGGLGRTGMVIGCYLVRHGRSAEEALQYIQDCWRSAARPAHPMSPETPAQAQFVRDWHRHEQNGE